MLALVATAFPSLTAGECAAGLVGSGFNFGLVERYGEWFDNNSSVSMTHGSHICSLCRGGRLRTEPALAAVWTFETHGLPGSRRPGRKDQSAHGPIYTNNATCSFEVPTERRLLFGAQPQAGVCVPT